MDKQSSVASISTLVSKRDSKIGDGDKIPEVKQTFWMEYFVAFAVSLSFGMFGVHCGWFGPTYLLLMDKTLELYISPAESAWVSGSLQIGALPGPFIGSYIANRFGRQKAILATTLPNLITFILVACATNVYMLFLSRFFAGIATGITFVAAPIYISEIASPKIRGFLNHMVGVVIPLCSILEFALIPILSIRENAFLIIAFVGVQIVIFCCIPESPQFHMAQRREDRAEKSLIFLRQTKNVAGELAQLKVTNNVTKISYVESLKVTVRSKAFAILVGTIMAQQFSGLVAIYSYSPVIIDKAQDTLSVQFSLILIQVIGIIMAVASSFGIDSAGRKPLFIGSAGLCSFSTAIIATYFLLDELHYSSIRSLSWAPLVGIILFSVGSSFGIISIPHLFVGELFSVQCRAVAGSIISILGSFFGLVVTLLYQYLSGSFGMSFVFWVFTVLNFCSMIFGFLVLPETKGRTLEEIQDDLNGNNKRRMELRKAAYENSNCVADP